MEQISSADVRIPRGGDKVYKDQCVYCFQSPVSGLLAREMSMSSFAIQ